MSDSWAAVPTERPSSAWVITQDKLHHCSSLHKPAQMQEEPFPTAIVTTYIALGRAPRNILGFVNFMYFRVL